MKRAFALFLSFVMVLSLCPVSSFGLNDISESTAKEIIETVEDTIEEQSSNDHVKRGLFGGSLETTHVHDSGTEDEVEFETPITTEDELRALFTNGGSGYLYNDIKLEGNDRLSIVNNINVSLCLNGKTLDLNGKSILVWDTLRIYDCGSATAGTIKNGIGGGYADLGGAIGIYYPGEVYLYGGTITECSAECGGAVGCYGEGKLYMFGGNISKCTASFGGAVDCSDGSFHMYGGSITENTAVGEYNSEKDIFEGGRGGAIFNDDAPMSFHMHGGEISGNAAAYCGGGVYNMADITFDGRCVVKDNYSYHGNSMDYDSNKVRDNVFTTVPFYPYYDTTSKPVPIEEGSEIWITLAEGNSFRVKGAFATGITDDQAQYFRSDVDAYYVKYVSEGDTDGYAELVSRLIEQPTVANGHKVTVYDDDITPDPVSYQWMQRITKKVDLKDAYTWDTETDYGIVGSDGNSITSEYDEWDAGEEYEAGYGYYIYFLAPYGTSQVIYESQSSGVECYYWASVEEKNGKFYYSYQYSPLAFYLLEEIYGEGEENPEEFSIENVKLVMNPSPYDDRDDQLSNAIPGVLYYCNIMFPDGSELFSEDTSFDAEPHVHDKGTEDTSDDIIFDKALVEGGSLSGNYYLTKDIDLTYDIVVPEGEVLNLCLNGYRLRGSGEDSAIKVEGTLNLYDCEDHEKITRYYSDEKCEHGVTVGEACSECATCMHGVQYKGYCEKCDGYVEDIVEDSKIAKKDGFYETLFSGEGVPEGKYVTVAGGFVTGGNRDADDSSLEYGGAICVGSGASFNLYSGSIACSSADQGGAVYVSYKGKFDMYGGSIINCYASDGGAVTVDSEGVFTMHKGNIVSCSASGRGGAVSAQGNNGELIMRDGSITDCSAASGGAVDCCCGIFHMYGGEISGNRATAYADSGAGLGGGVYNGHSMASFHMHGGSITGNIAQGFGGGVYNQKHTTFDGKCIIKDNYAYHYKEIKDANKCRDNVFTTEPLFIGSDEETAGTISEGSEIWVTLSNEDEKTYPCSGAVTSNGKSSEVQYFLSDADCYYVSFNEAASEEEEDHIVLLSRLIQQPTKDNSYSVKVKMDGLTKDIGYSDPADSAKDLLYQWKKAVIISTGLKDLNPALSIDEGYGTAVSGTNSVQSSFSEASSFAEIFFNIPKGIDHITFSSDASGIVLYDEDDYSLEKEDDIYTYRMTGDSRSFDIVISGAVGPFTINDLTFHKEGYESIEDTDAKLDTGASSGQTYYCTVTFIDGSALDSEKVLYETSAHIHSWTYAVDGTDHTKLTAICANGDSGHTGSTTETLTISAPTLTIYGETGKSEKATLSGTALGGLTVSADNIKYYQKTGGSYGTEALSEAPTSAGTYKACITVNDGNKDHTAYVEYTIAEKKEEICKYTAALTSGKDLTLLLGGEEAGTFTITGSSSCGFSLKAENGQYIAFSDKKVKESASSYTWKYDGGLYAEVKTTTTTTSKCGWGWFSWGRKTTTTTTTTTKYYLGYNGSEFTLSTSKVTAEIFVTADEHTWDYYHDGDGKHEAYCTKCGHREDPETHDFTYDPENHMCFCGVIDPDYGGVTEVSVKETANTTTSYNRGWGWGFFGCGQTKVSSYTYKISTKQTNVTVKKVEYCTDGKTWKSGSEFKSTSKLTSFTIRVTDSNGRETYWKYDSGKVSKVTD